MGIKVNIAPGHNGGFLKRAVIPESMSVTDAAKFLNVGRPTLSNLLNEKASLSPEMAMRFEKVFGINTDTLLRMQARYDAWQVCTNAKKIKVKKYKPEMAMSA